MISPISSTNPTVTTLIFTVSFGFQFFHFLSQKPPSMPRILSAKEPLRRGVDKLGKPMIGDDGTVYTCAGKYVYAFHSNGSIAWTVHLNYTCHTGIPPVYGGKRKVYVVAENKVLRINSFNVGTHGPAAEVFFSKEPDTERPDEIVGLSASMLTSSVYINIKNKGLFAYRLQGQLRWSVEPVLCQFGYCQGCKKNVTNCYFNSVPVVDQCEASVYVSNNQGELYSLSARGPPFKWIQDFSMFDNTLTIITGNNGRLYLTIPTKALVFALDVSTGDILWQRSIGPLSTVDYAPVVDSNGWISIGSLDGFLYSISPKGSLKKFTKASPVDSVIQVSSYIDCSGYAIYVAQTEMEGKRIRVVGNYTFVSANKPRGVLFSLLAPAIGSFYWSEVYPGGPFTSNLSESNLREFIVDEGLVLAFIAAANTANPLQCRSTRQKLASSCSEARPKRVEVYTGNERAILLFLLFETIILAILAIGVRFCWVFWGKTKLRNQHLGVFLEKRRSLRLKKKEYDRTISKLEQTAAQEASTSDVLNKMSDLVTQREFIKRKLSTTYSLGRDIAMSPSKSLLPLFDEKPKSYSFRGSRKESFSIFHTLTDTSIESNSDCDPDTELETEVSTLAKGKGKAKVKEGAKVASVEKSLSIFHTLFDTSTDSNSFSDPDTESETEASTMAKGKAKVKEETETERVEDEDDNVEEMYGSCSRTELKDGILMAEKERDGTRKRGDDCEVEMVKMRASGGKREWLKRRSLSSTR